MTVPLDGFDVTPMTFDGVTRDVYRRGKGPGVIVMHEIPGITPAVARFATTVADAGFSVRMPHMFGTPGKPMSGPYALGQIVRAVCISKEFRTFAANESSPIVSWLRALCAATHAELGGRGVGAIGMCLTGNFALAMMVEPSMMAPVLSQPSLPFPLGAGKRGLHISSEDLVIAKRRAKEGVPLLAMRFTNDLACPAERFQRLRDELGDAVETIEIDSSRGNAHGIPRRAHSVVTNDLVDEAGHPTRIALDRVIAFYRENLGA